MSAASSQAQEYAAKKRAALERANAMRKERDAKTASSSLISDSRMVVQQSRQVTVQSYPNVERIIIHHPTRQLPAPSVRSPLAPTSSASVFRAAHAGESQKSFSAPPLDASGREYDLSSRPLLCCSSFFNPILNKREIVYGGADHALYAIQSTSPSMHPSPVVKMYSKQFGHTDWVTSVAHLSDGRVISSAMDGKLCLWELNKRRCEDLIHHTKSVSKVVGVSDAGSVMCVSASYDCSLAVWNFGSMDSNSSSSRSRGALAADTGGRPVVTLTGHKSPVLELACTEGIAASGGRDGAIVSWDLATGEQLQRVRGHEAPITALQMYSPKLATSAASSLLTGAADGTVKLWDPRSKQLTSSGVPHPGTPVTGLQGSFSMAGSSGVGGGSDLIVTAGADGVLLVFDRRKGFKTADAALQRFQHARNGIYCMALVEEGSQRMALLDSGSPTSPILLVGDGIGALLCYDLHTMTLRYALGSSRVGAVRCVAAFRQDRLLAIGNEDGKCLMYDY